MQKFGRRKSLPWVYISTGALQEQYLGLCGCMYSARNQCIGNNGGSIRDPGAGILDDDGLSDGTQKKEEKD